MEALLAALEKEFGAGKVFRPYRDVRFTKDKTPYKDHCGGVVELGRGGGAYYVQVSSAGLLVGGGSFAMASDQLARYRTAVDDERRGEALEKIIAKLASAGWQLHGDQLKSRPRGFDADHPRIDLLRSTVIVRITHAGSRTTCCTSRPAWTGCAGRGGRCGTSTTGAPTTSA